MYISVNNKNLIMKKIILALLLGVTMVSVGQEKVLLRLNYEKGDAYEMNMKMTQDMGATMSMSSNMTMLQNVKSVSGDEYEIDSKITKIVMNMSQGGMQMSYDSSKKEEELDETGKMMKTQMGPMLQAVITTKSNSLGKVIETKVVPNVPGASDLTQQSNSVVYPEKAVILGDTWSMTKDSKGMKFNFIYKVKAITLKNVSLDISGTVEGLATGNITGFMNVDKKSGLPLTSKINMAMKIQGQDLKTNINMTMVKK